MSDGQDQGSGVGWGEPPTGLGAPPSTSSASKPNPGWYPDPWVRGQHRYWNGDNWTADAFPHGPAEDAVPRSFAPPGEPRNLATGPPPPPPQWSSPPGSTAPANPPTTPIPPVRTEERPRVPRHHVIAILLLVPLIVGLSSFAGFYFANRGGSSSNAQSTPPTSSNSPSSPPVTASPPALGTLGLNQSDVTSGVTVQLLPNGDQLSTATLDLCNGTFPSESLRTARRQVAAVDNQANTLISTEAVTYSSAAGTAQAFSELAATATKCPGTPVTSPVGEPTVTTHFNPPPDGSWPQVQGVQRLAFDFTATDESGQNTHNVAVYLRRGRVLLGIYFNQPDGAQTAVDGQTTIPGIVNLFSARMAQLPASVVGG